MRSAITILILFAVLPVAAQPVTILFKVGSQMPTELQEVNDTQLVTKHGPYFLKDIRSLTFTDTAADTATLELISMKGIEILLKTKKYKSLYQKKEKARQDSIWKVKSSVDPITQQPLRTDYHSSMSAGFGMGLDYGGIGMRLTMLPTSPVSIFGGVGYNFYEVGYNAGIDFNFTPTAQSSGFISAMYGYNAVITRPVAGMDAKTYYGPSFGIGAKLREKQGENYFSIQFIYSIRDQEFINAPKSDEPWPLVVSIGYHLASR